MILPTTKSLLRSSTPRSAAAFSTALAITACALAVSVQANASDHHVASEVAPLASLDAQARDKAEACKLKMKVALDKLKQAKGQKLTGDQLRARVHASMKAWAACARDLNAFFLRHDRFESHRYNMNLVMKNLRRAMKTLEAFSGGDAVSDADRAKLAGFVREANQKYSAMMRELR